MFLMYAIMFISLAFYVAIAAMAIWGAVDLKKKGQPKWLWIGLGLIGALLIFTMLTSIVSTFLMPAMY